MEKNQQKVLEAHMAIDAMIAARAINGPATNSEIQQQLADFLTKHKGRHMSPDEDIEALVSATNPRI